MSAIKVNVNVAMKRVLLRGQRQFPQISICGESDLRKARNASTKIATLGALSNIENVRVQKIVTKTLTARIEKGNFDSKILLQFNRAVVVDSLTLATIVGWSGKELTGLNDFIKKADEAELAAISQNPYHGRSNAYILREVAGNKNTPKESLFHLALMGYGFHKRYPAEFDIAEIAFNNLIDRNLIELKDFIGLLHTKSNDVFIDIVRYQRKMKDPSLTKALGQFFSGQKVS